MSALPITYAIEHALSSEEFVDILIRSGLAERRPVNEPERIAAMLEHCNLMVTARHEGRLVGVARSLTDFCYCCYLSDLAVDKAYQHQGIGKKLIEETRKALTPQTLLLLLAAPAAAQYYEKVGFQKEEAAWSIRPASVSGLQSPVGHTAVE